MANQIKLTPWYPVGSKPARDGCYIVRRDASSECWHFCRWNSATSSWFSAGSDGKNQSDVIGWTMPNHTNFQWRGVSK